MSDININDWKKSPSKKYKLDDSILQTKTATNLVEIIKEALTITKVHTRFAKDVNRKMEDAVKFHNRAIKKLRRKEIDVTKVKPRTGIYHVNL
jgi:hypothetical protein